MSKRNKSTKTTDEPKEPTPSEDFLESEGSIMATEAKIGLAIIGALLIAFAVVLFYRMNKSNEKPITDSSTNEKDEKSEKESTETPTPINQNSTLKPNEPTIMEPPSFDSDVHVASAEVNSGWSGMVGDQGGMVGDQGNLATIPENPPHASQEMPIASDGSVIDDMATKGIQDPVHETHPNVPEKSEIPPFPLMNGPEHTGQPDPLEQPAVLVTTPPVDNTFRSTSSQVAPPERIPTSNPQDTIRSGPVTATPVSEYDYSSIAGGVKKTISAPSVSQSLPADGVYTIQANDNYWVISKKLYGTGSYFQALAEYNRKDHPDPSQLRLGETITAPTSQVLEKTYPDFCPRPEHRRAADRHASLVSTHGRMGRIYVVQKGDSLSAIAKHELGNVSYVKELLELNRDLVGNNYHYLTPGMKLVLPDKEPKARVTRAPGSTY